MDPMAEEQLDYEDEEYGGSQKVQYHGGGAISALAEDEIIGEDDEYDDLYNDVNVGEGFLQLQQQQQQQSEAPPVPPIGTRNEESLGQNTNILKPKSEPMTLNEQNTSGITTEGKYMNTGPRFPDQIEGLNGDRGSEHGLVNVKKEEPTDDVQPVNSAFQGGSIAMPQQAAVTINPVMPGKVVNDSAGMLNSDTGTGPRGVSPMPANQMVSNVNVNLPIVNENHMKSSVDNGATMLFVGELHWWTTDAELESVLSQYGRVKEIKFFDERASGKSKGYCQVEFYDSAAATACKEGMDGYVFNGRACVVAFASPHTIRQMGMSFMNKSQVQSQTQQQQGGRRPLNDGGGGRGAGTNFSGGDGPRNFGDGPRNFGDGGRNFGRGGWGRGQGILNRGPGGNVPMRGRGGAFGAKNMVGNAHGVGGGAYGQGLANPGFGGPPGGFMHPQGVMGAGFDPTYMGRGAGYGGFPGPAFPGMMPPFPAVNTMGLAGVAPHVNPAFFGRGMPNNGMGMMGSTGMEGHHAGMWSDNSMGGGGGGWGGEEHGGQRTRESSYGGEDGGSEYGYAEVSNDKGGGRSNAASREKERVSEREWSGTSEKRHREDREPERERYDRDHRYKEEKESYREHRQKERDFAYEEDWDRGHSSSRPRSRSRAVPEEDHRSRSRDADYGKRRRLPSE